jgi:hypothetical protein
MHGCRFLVAAAIISVPFLVLAAGPDLPNPATAEDSGLVRSAADLPPVPPRDSAPRLDWLVQGGHSAAVFRGRTAKELVLDNGLIRRRFRLEPDAATVEFENVMTGSSIIRAVKPEAIVSFNGRAWDVGGLIGQPEPAYLLPDWLDEMRASTGALHCVGFELTRTQAPFAWKRKRHASDSPWPPPGVGVRFEYASSEPELNRVRVAVHYELYDGLPVIGKWIAIHNGSSNPITLDAFTSEVLATAEVESAVDERAFRNWRLPAITLLSDYSFHGMDATTASQTTTWLPDPTYTSQVNYEMKMPAIVVSRPPIGPDLLIKPGEDFTSFRTFVVVYDSDDRERQGLILRKAQRALAPWATENPIMMHVRSAKSDAFRLAVDQCAEVGFEMIIYTFGSGLDMENVTPEYLAKIRADVDYAHGKGIEVGAYSLLASRRVSDGDDVINPATGKVGGAIFGNSPCLCSRWGEQYFARIRRFIEETGLDLLEHDGSYPGDFCASTTHPGHRGVKDSQWMQWEKISHFYRWCRERGTYLNVPDYYFLAGSSKTGMGYRESNWSLPRERQIILGRQNIYDGTWTKAPSMGWMFVPLVEYQGGGAAATLEPLHDHLRAYGAHLANNFGAGVQACYRGPRLYDAAETKAMVQHWVGWFKEHRAILESDMIHVRRPDGQDLDCFLHINPALKERAMAVVYNPLRQDADRVLELPLRYSGLTDRVLVRQDNGITSQLVLDREYRLRVPVHVPAEGVSWCVMEQPENQ